MTANEYMKRLLAEQPEALKSSGAVFGAMVHDAADVHCAECRWVGDVFQWRDPQHPGLESPGAWRVGTLIKPPEMSTQGWVYTIEPRQSPMALPARTDALKAISSPEQDSTQEKK